MGKLSRDKGKTGEREAAHKLSQLLGVRFHRTAQHKGNHNAADIDSDNGTRLHLEIKRSERLRLYDALDQAANDSGADDVPVVLHRPNRRPWVAIVYLDDLTRLVDAVGELRR